ncbi:hypothetical protein QBC47DRAFT_357842 [Echria macrotheca]|uniref:Uncharacterized protein n=1 Tax=Echria macrotheca TaxID=438768 RepID=A0AAJ0FE57_9PEZI|nr:hypothetical protein QBC47DRAFT_357842 [Echria macrotheca]
MSPTPSIAKASILSPSTSISSPPPPPRKTHHCASNSPNYFPPSHPTRTLYLVARSTSVLLGLLQITLAAIAYTLFSRRWLDPTLSPAITTFIYSAIEIFSVLYWHARAHYYTRAFYDGGISVGFAVAAGFMVKLAVGRKGKGGSR